MRADLSVCRSVCAVHQMVVVDVSYGELDESLDSSSESILACCVCSGLFDAVCRLSSATLVCGG